MELIDGVDFLEYVRPSGRPWTQIQHSEIQEASTLPVSSPLAAESLKSVALVRPSYARRQGKDIDLDRLRKGLVQLARGLVALHQAQKVHRDIKPSNILVNREGRVILLDFGLATNIGAAKPQQVLGTPNYMAPEQAAQQTVGPAADWYSVGAILYQALTDQLPFEGHVLEVMRHKQLSEPLPPSAIVPGIPEDLEKLCVNLLKIKTEARPEGLDVLRRLGADVGFVRERQQRGSGPIFVGRTGELRTLQKAYEETRGGKGATVFLHGESGVGKSELVQQFGETLSDRALVLAGRCYERESVPYKAVDGVVDALSDYMAELPLERAAVLVPRDAALLLKAFPVLNRVEVLTQAPPVHEVLLDAQEMRSRVFAALRELVCRLAHHTPVVILIDDLQWADLDSITLLAEITRAPNAPNMLLIATLRTLSDDSTHAGLQTKLEQIPDVRHLHVEPLPPEHAEELVARLAVGTGIGVDAHRIAEEAGGHPLFIAELVRHSFSEDASKEFRLDDALKQRIDALPTPARRILDLLAIAGRPLARKTVARAAEMEFNQLINNIEFLRTENLARTAGTRRSDTVEPYHDRVREIVAKFAAENSRNYHKRLALALEATGDLDPEALSIHWEGAGDDGRALGFAVQAGEQAATALAFDRAVRLYRRAESFFTEQTQERGMLLIKLGEALANAGRGLESAQIYQKAAELVPSQEAVMTRQRAADQFLRSGHVDAGIAAMVPMLESKGIMMPRTPRGALFSFLRGRLMLKLRRPRMGFVEHSESEIPQEVIERLDLFWSATVGLFIVDQIRGLDFHMRYLRLALDSGEPFRVACGLAIEAASVATVGGSKRSVSRLLQRTRDIADRLDRPYLNGFFLVMSGAVALVQGRWSDGLSFFSDAEKIFVETCSGVAWELASVRLNMILCKFNLGRLKEISEQTRRNVSLSRERGDLLSVIGNQAGFSNVTWLLDDDVEGARREANMAIDQWSQRGFHLQHLLDLLAQVQIDLYSNDGVAGYERLLASWRHIVCSGLLKVNINRIMVYELRGRCSIALAKADVGRRKQALKSVKVDSKRLAREQHCHSVGYAHLLEAQVAIIVGDESSMVSNLHAAEELFATADMKLLELLVKSHSSSAERGIERNSCVDRFLKEQGAKCPENFVRMLAPGFAISDN